ncbi:hypothetical protein BJ912DRAFT_1141791 [Pholiota molesta]|nr:hypothetical protein BJ912DRAFT_1141791 [Pholiota molesta]
MTITSPLPPSLAHGHDKQGTLVEAGALVHFQLDKGTMGLPAGTFGSIHKLELRFNRLNQHPTGDFSYPAHHPRSSPMLISHAHRAPHSRAPMTKEGEERARGDPGVGDPQGTPPYAFRPRSPLTTTAPHSLHARQRGATARPRSIRARPRHRVTSPARDIVPHHPPATSCRGARNTMTTAPHCLPRRPAAHDTMTTKAPPLPRHRAAAHAHDDNGHPTPAMSSRPAPARCAPGVPRHPPATLCRGARTR